MTTDTTNQPVGAASETAQWLKDDTHRAWLIGQARSQFDFFKRCLRAEPGFHLLDLAGNTIPGAAQELHSTTRMVHSYVLGKLAGIDGADDIIDHGMSYIWSHHRDAEHGGYIYALDENGIKDGTKLAYGHVFVLLAGASAKIAGHPDADRLIADATEVLETRYWDEQYGLFSDEFNRDWTPFSTYRGMNANMHGIEALLTAYEATGEKDYLIKAGRIVEFFTAKMAPEFNGRLPEHYSENWQVDPHYEGNPMFRPAGTTPGHSFEVARLAVQYWDLAGRPDDGSAERARRLFDKAYADAWDKERGGIVYTVGFDGAWIRPARYWWPVTEAIGAAAVFQKLGWSAEDEALYRKLWNFANERLIDHEAGGWFPELGTDNKPASEQFGGKPDIYHAIQATLFPLSDRIGYVAEDLRGLLAE